MSDEGLKIGRWMGHFIGGLGFAILFQHGWSGAVAGCFGFGLFMLWLYSPNR